MSLANLKNSLGIALAIVCASFSVMNMAKAAGYDRVVVLGTSLSDSGNAFTLINNAEEFGFGQCEHLGIPLNVPPYDQMDKLVAFDDLYELLVPDGVYARGGHHVTNGATWIEQWAKGQGLSGTVRPGLKNQGLRASNYAVGGARARLLPAQPPANDADLVLYQTMLCRFNLDDQLQAYLDDFGVDQTHPISADTLFVIEMGGNDVRDALNASNPEEVLQAALGNISQTVQTLYASGARNFLLMNVPNIARTPTIGLLDGLFPSLGIADGALALTIGFNDGVTALRSGLSGALRDADIRVLDVFALLEAIIADQELNNASLYGINNVTEACIKPNTPPFTCKKPDTYLFWDGIHPTRAVHGFIANEAVHVLQQ